MVGDHLSIQRGMLIHNEGLINAKAANRAAGTSALKEKTDIQDLQLYQLRDQLLAGAELHACMAPCDPLFPSAQLDKVQRHLRSSRQANSLPECTRWALVNRLVSVQC